ncbi:MAG: SPOR domain-containing protein, partial [Campylobacterales bacterium]|nr:SPOR domain-containing protein [Campylobacterales bacterium]
IGLVFAVLIGAILLTKMILEEPQKPKIPVEENLTNSALIQADIKESNGSDINDSTIQAANVDKQIVDDINATIGTSKTEQNRTNAIMPSKVATPARAVAAKKIIEKQTHKPIPVKNKANAEQNTKTNLVKKDQNKTDTKPATTTLKSETVKTSDTPKSETKPTVKNMNVKKEQISSETYYAQVGAFSNKPNDGFISIIKKNGYSYKVVSGQNGSSKILIGPYEGKEKANIALEKIRDRINKSAFLVKQ